MYFKKNVFSIIKSIRYILIKGFPYYIYIKMV